MWQLTADLTDSDSIKWKLNFTDFDFAQNSVVTIDFQFPFSATAKVSTRHEYKTVVRSELMQARRKHRIVWLETEPHDEFNWVINLDEFGSFIKTKFKDRVDVMGSHIFNHLSGRVLVDVGYTSGGFVDTRGGESKDWDSLLMFISNHHLKGWTASVVGPALIENSLMRFRSENVSGGGRAFIMMKFGGTRLHNEITETIRNTLGEHKIIGMRADDRQYHDDLFFNILTYMHGCEFGIAVFERLQSNEFNPNVSLEVGYMLALGKPVCLLKDATLSSLHTDLAGKLYRTFDPQEPSKTVASQSEEWLRDKKLIPDRLPRKPRKKREVKQ